MIETRLRGLTILLKGFSIINTMRNFSKNTYKRHFTVRTQWLFVQSPRNLWHMIEETHKTYERQICIQKLCVIDE